MVKTFRPVTSPDFLKMLEESRIGKALIEMTGLSAFEMLNQFRLNLPTSSNPSEWLVECDTNRYYNPHDVTLFLKYAWLYSETESNEHIDHLIHLVAKELTSFEKDLLIQEGQAKLNETAIILKSQDQLIAQKQEEVTITQQELFKSHLELGAKLQKEKNTSTTNSNSASKPRGCEEVDKYLQELVKSNPCKSTKELWFLISGERDGSDFYRENGKIYHENCEDYCNEFGIKAFYARIKRIKNSS